MQQSDLAIPTLPSRSIDATVEFYKQLGFEGGKHEFNSSYAIMLRDSVEIHFFRHEELIPEQSAFGCYIRVQDVDSIYTAFGASQLPKSGIPRMDSLQDKPWGLREFAVVDPDGNLLRIGQLLGK